MSTTYRPSIDGLRAVSIGAVLGFHAFPGVVTGGFAGVDVFFVISGYLITGIIRTEARAGTFSFRRFYARRAIRLFPALVVVLAPNFLFGWLVLTQAELTPLAKHLAASVAFVVNFTLWNESGYFAAPAATKPLLHLWSLGIEEQFYILWPVVVLAFTRLRVSLAWPALVVLAGSLAMSIVYTTGGQGGAAYYSPLSRFWELMMGAVLATGVIGRPGPKASEVCAAAGLTLILASVFVLESTSPFPGWRALPPTVGAALVLLADDRTFAGRLLALKPFVAVGLISYPLYLWHWPLLSFANIMDEDVVSGGIRLAAVALAIVLAASTYLFVERPLQRAARQSGRRSVAYGTTAAMAILGALALWCWTGRGFPSPPAKERPVMNAGETGHEVYNAYLASHFAACERPTVKGGFNCLESKAGAPRDVVLLGDSHSTDLLIGLSEQLPKWNIVSYGQGFLPMPTFADVEEGVVRIEKDPAVKAVVIASAYHVRMFLKDVDSIEEIRRGLRDIVARLQTAGKRVILIDDLPYFNFPVDRCKYALRRAPWREGIRCEMPRSLFDEQQKPSSDMLRSLQKEFPSTEILHAGDAFCDAAECRMAGAGTLWFREEHHLTIAGSKKLAAVLVQESPVLSSLKRGEAMPSVPRP